MGLVGWDVRVGIWSMAWGSFLQSLEEGIAAAAAAASATLPEMTMRREAVPRENDCMSYCALFWDLEGCGSYVTDVGYRIPDGGLLVKSILNSSSRGVGDLLMITTTTVGERGGCANISLCTSGCG
jgi:hypothetical protein